MKKKEVDRTSFRNNRKQISSTSKKAQITIFIIVGILILFSFIFVISMMSEVEEGKLKKAQETMIAKVFKKEALRIFVEDCLTDELENGLILIGKQGRLWSDQPGGTKDYDPGKTGISLGGGDRVFYGISKEVYLEKEEAYPCDNETNGPEFCRYRYPNTKVGYGKLELKTSTLQNDLRRYLMNRTVWCVENYTRTNISSKAFIKTEKIGLKLKIENDGIDVKVDYPLKLILGGEEFFHLSKFDFFYPTKFKGLLDSAVAYPLQMDWKFIDFNYTNEVINGSCPYEDTGGPCTYFTHGIETPYTTGCPQLGDYYLCDLSLRYDLYSSLAVEMTTEESEESGDTIYEFKSPLIINRPETFVYRFVRQNRPPALDYVRRLECPALLYDYLVIKDDPDYGNIDITAFALDPDEDGVSYHFSSDLANSASEENKFYVLGGSIPQQKKDIFAYAIDNHELTDWQRVRVLVDRPMDISSELWVPYNLMLDGELLSYSEVMERRGGNSYLISNEDPIFVNITLPEDSLLSEGEIITTLSYKSTNEIIPPFGLPYSTEIAGMEKCFPLPNNAKQGTKKYKCNKFEDYGNLIKEWDKEITYFDMPYFQELTDEKRGQLNISFEMEYCEDFLGNSKTIDVVVKECIPHRNPEHPFAYPYHGYLFDNYDFVKNEGDYTGDKNAEINPFLATHSCCISGIFEVYEKEDEHPCFINPDPGCYGRIEYPYYTIHLNSKSGEEEGYEGYILEQQERLCSGERGNICDGDPRYTLWEDDEGDDILMCGYNLLEFPGCGGIETKCEGALAWGYVNLDEDEDMEGWCWGEMGCTQICRKEDDAVVFTGPIGDLTSSQNGINTFAREYPEKTLYYQCGCGGVDGEKWCDTNFDGVFDEKCCG